MNLSLRRATITRYYTLDAARGLAAILVTLYHYGLFVGGYAPRFGYLAVDFFFVLSGFVIASAYDRKFADGRLDAISFMRVRFERLAPLYALGALLGICVWWIGVYDQLTNSRFIIVACLNFVGFPTPYSSFVFPINIPFWSLFFEFWVANLLFGLEWARLTGGGLLALVAAGAVGLIVVQVQWHTVDVGFARDNFLGGFARVGFSFFAGVVIARYHDAHPTPMRCPAGALLALLLLILTAPLHGLAAQIFECLALFLFFPLLIYLGAGALERVPRLGRFLGDTSYALYTIHMPIVLSLGVLRSRVPGLDGLAVEFSICASLFLMAALAAYADERFRAKWRVGAGFRPARRT